MKIEDAIITEKALKELVILQADNNYEITIYIESLSEAVCCLLEVSESLNDDDAKAMLLAARNLSSLRSILRNMKAETR